jgi:hypothetical protein
VWSVIKIYKEKSYKYNSMEEYFCNICNTKYKCYQSFWYHNKTQHTPKYECRKCQKVYYNKQSRWSHEKKCGKKNEIDDVKN